MRQSQNEAIFNDENPFKSIYQQTHCKTKNLQDSQIRRSQNPDRRPATNMYYRTPEKAHQTPSSRHRYPDKI